MDYVWHPWKEMLIAGHNNSLLFFLFATLKNYLLYEPASRSKDYPNQTPHGASTDIKREQEVNLSSSTIESLGSICFSTQSSLSRLSPPC